MGPFLCWTHLRNPIIFGVNRYTIAYYPLQLFLNWPVTLPGQGREEVRDRRPT
ncbi:hypothetical protein GmarT_27360 [Gimesia maris]|uniref:Uncharacterized protein n=1 Tax=Gimesia maris TaxID=122 RepID=A0ABX5YMR0_9PLAN|nr:hypothetical protein GmarT_27360 [Gimesia maris]